MQEACSIPELGRSPGAGSGNALQYFYLENPMDRGVWWVTVHGFTKNQTWLRDKHMALYWAWNVGSCFCRDTVPPQFSLFYRRWQESRNSVKEYPDKYRFHIISEFSDHKFLLINFDNLSSSNTTDSLQLNNTAQSTIITVSYVKKNMYIFL